MTEYKQREFPRISYPRETRPILAFEYDEYEVEDISEHGIKIIIDQGDPSFMAGDHLMSMIVFPKGREFDIDGRVVRVEDNHVGVQLDAALPKSLIRSEALDLLYLRHHSN